MPHYAYGFEFRISDSFAADGGILPYLLFVMRK